MQQLQSLPLNLCALSKQGPHLELPPVQLCRFMIHQKQPEKQDSMQTESANPPTELPSLQQLLQSVWRT